ncbi:VOC family protein [Amycolatopsis sp. H20-H5]|uniref:VOC family protein n=1 Tax=Amycolatopsis sp. H20-H5 TaxID=3046309 RepID=UPI002DBD42C8|nr:VOC family protein [Amycolatopsis sp. H20-H5]MEC3978607.1 VOC family protein [Amycolatopsis sp. H20-H5]
MAYDFQVTIDSADPHTLAEWWADLLGWVVEPSDEAFIREMIGKGYASDEDTTTHRGNLVWKVGAGIHHPDTPEGVPPRRMLFQLVPEGKTVKNRVHLDIRMGADKVEAELERLTGLGAKVLYRNNQGPYHWITIADPEGNELCLT